MRRAGAERAGPAGNIAAHRGIAGPKESAALSASNPEMLQSVFTWVDEHYDKVAGEEAVLNSSEVKGSVLRLPMVYGPGDRLHRFFALLKRFADGRSSILLADDLAAWRGPRGYVENIAHAVALAATSERAAGA